MQNKLKSLFNRDKDTINTERTEKTLMTNLFRIPVALVIISMIILGVSVALRTGNSLRSSLEDDSETLIYNIASRLEDNAISLETLEDSLADEINIVFDNMVIDQEELDNDYIIETARILGVDELNYYDENVEIIYSTVPEFIGIQSAPEHPVTIFQESGEPRLVEAMRTDTEATDENIYKYGALRVNDGDIVQIGIDAGRLADLSNTLAYQTVIKNVSYDTKFDYVRLIDPNNTIIASGNEDEIDTKLNEAESSPLVNETLQTGEMTSDDFYDRKEKILDIAYPLYLEEELIGILSVGLNTDAMNELINSNVVGIAVVGIVAMVLVAYVLYRASANAVTIIGSFETDLELMANGDFTNDIPEEILMREDEFGNIANASNRMKESIRNILRNVTNQAEVVAAHSEELTATSDQSAMASDELASVIQEVAATSTSQANDVENGTKAIHELERIINTNETHMEVLNQSVYCKVKRNFFKIVDCYY